MSVELTELLAKQKPTKPTHTPKMSMSVSSQNGVQSGEHYNERQHSKYIRGDKVAYAA